MENPNSARFNLSIFSLFWQNHKSHNSCIIFHQKFELFWATCLKYCICLQTFRSMHRIIQPTQIEVIKLCILYYCAVNMRKWFRLLILSTIIRGSIFKNQNICSTLKQIKVTWPAIRCTIFHIQSNLYFLSSRNFFLYTFLCNATSSMHSRQQPGAQQAWKL